MLDRRERLEADPEAMELASREQAAVRQLREAEAVLVAARKAKKKHWRGSVAATDGSVEFS